MTPTHVWLVTGYELGASSVEYAYYVEAEKAIEAIEAAVKRSPNLFVTSVEATDADGVVVAR